MAIIANEWIRADIKLGFGQSFEPVIRLMMTLTGTNLLIHVFGSLLMTLNRYTVYKPKLHYELWTNKRTKCMLVADFILSYLAYTEWFLTKFVYIPTADGWLIEREHRTFASRLMGALTVFISEIINMVLIAYTVRSIRRQRKMYNRKGKLETNLVVLTIIGCPANLLEALYDFSFLFNSKDSVTEWIRSQMETSRTDFYDKVQQQHTNYQHNLNDTYREIMPVGIIISLFVSIWMIFMLISWRSKFSFKMDGSEFK